MPEAGTGDSGFRRRSLPPGTVPNREPGGVARARRPRHTVRGTLLACGAQTAPKNRHRGCRQIEHRVGLGVDGPLQRWTIRVSLASLGVGVPLVLRPAECDGLYGTREPAIGPRLIVVE